MTTATKLGVRPEQGMYRFVTDAQYAVLIDLFLKGERLAREDPKRRLGDLRLLFETGHLRELAEVLHDDDTLAHNNGWKILQLSPGHGLKSSLLWTLRQQISEYHCEEARNKH